jgi:hypothetical protein
MGLIDKIRYSAFRKYSDPYTSSTFLFVEKGCNVIKKKTEITSTSVFRPFTQYFVEAPLTAITALSL